MISFLTEILNPLLHLNQHLPAFAASYGALTYALLFAIIFLETGLVILPFLPGDSLLFAAGALTAMDSGIDFTYLCILLCVAAILGDALNFALGRSIGHLLDDSEKLTWISRRHIDATHQYFKNYGRITIIICRFIPVIRTFAPFLAGAGGMCYRVFALYNVFGAALWIGLILTAGFLFGNIPIVKQNFSLVILVIVLVSLLPVITGLLKHHYRAKGVINES